MKSVVMTCHKIKPESRAIFQAKPFLLNHVPGAALALRPGQIPQDAEVVGRQRQAHVAQQGRLVILFLAVGLELNRLFVQLFIMVTRGITVETSYYYLNSRIVNSVIKLSHDFTFAPRETSKLPLG